MEEDKIKTPTGRFNDNHNKGDYLEAATQSIVVLNKKFTETNKNINELGKSIEFTAGEIATFKEALCSVGEKMNASSNKLLRASKIYFWGILILTAVIAFAALAQSRIINFEKKIDQKPITKQSSRLSLPSNGVGSDG
ncbi:MAG: hypothetical protein Q7J67_03595 [bacterium]|nr:hypothetical protein [bacterium]